MFNTIGRSSKIFFITSCTLFLCGVFLTTSNVHATAGEDAAAIIAFLEKLYDEVLTPDDDERAANLMTTIALSSDTANKTKVDLHNARIQFDSAVPPSMCTNQESTQAVVASDYVVKSSATKLNQPMENININTKNPYAYSVQQMKTHKKHYCAKGEANCQPGRYPNADISAANFYKDAYDNQELKAAMAYTAKITNPNPTTPLSAEAQNTETALPIMNIMYSEAAKLSLAQQSLNRIIADRIPTEELGRVIGKEKASPKEVRDYEVYKRYGNPQWETETIEKPPASAVKDLALMTAYRINQAERLFEQNQRIEALLAVLVAQDTKVWSEEQMAELRELAEKAQR